MRSTIVALFECISPFIHVGIPIINFLGAGVQSLCAEAYKPSCTGLAEVASKVV
jgi:hypothetical protein